MLRIDLNEDIVYFKAGEFTADVGWMHKKMYHEDDFEIIYCLENTLSLLVNEKPILLKKNDCLIIPPQTTIQGAQLSAQPVHFYWIHFFAKWCPLNDEAELLIKTLRSSFIQHSVSPDYHSICFLPKIFSPKEPNFLIILINQLLNVTNTYYYSSKISDLLVQSILIELCNQYFIVSTVQSTDEHASKIHQIADWIRANMNEELTIQSVAETFELSQDYLSRQFKKELGQNLRDYLINLKISVAKVLLVQTVLPIKLVSELSYYADEKYFIRIFRKKTGLTPNKYRNAYSGTHLNNPYIDPKLPIPQRVEQYLDNNQ
ncbi:AraC family transcriptional regulator [Enterococcus mediterraneensis]|uniref:AraC family transcriptional regulator n=1 Tax=Enterococcus mediterraneensis TaxID=2364791 RepID=UPI000F067C94|nr:AraC family transcriptional regulator [Enterococcus mediterraneensis]